MPDVVELIIDTVIAQGATVRVADPEALEAFGGIVGRKRFSDSSTSPPPAVVTS